MRPVQRSRRCIVPRQRAAYRACVHSIRKTEGLIGGYGTEPSANDARTRMPGRLHRRAIETVSVTSAI